MSSTNSKWPADFLSWCQKELSKVLQSTVEEDLLSYLMSMEVEKDVKEYLQDLLNGQEATQVDVFLDEFFRHWRPPVDPASLQEEVAIEELVRPDRDKMALFTKNSEEVGTGCVISPLPPHSLLCITENTWSTSWVWRELSCPAY